MVVPQSNKREQVLKLIEEKDKIEAKINELGNVLRAVSFLMNYKAFQNPFYIYEVATCQYFVKLVKIPYDPIQVRGLNLNPFFSHWVCTGH